ncbi:Flp pilus assembly protein CpaB [uncultured Gimesia sp.]|uniref:Flp pilus assembly protein CpaB n=1 Tax=uncultured Gimesia sp. TaxID=1678688 RepID=UPI0030DD429B|tara:strand:+ start:59545 stop:60609 length:1065 start_codon:yes stop_codon:yes gene_type:complete
MKAKSLMMLVVAVGCGLVAMLGVRQVLSKDGDKEPVKTADVLMTIAEIAPGTPLNESNVKFKSWPIDQVPEGSVTKLEEYKDRSIKTRAVPGEIVMKAKLSEQGVRGASVEIPDGKRVFTTSVDMTKTHSGLILPGDFVDVYVTFTARKPGGGMSTITKVILERVKIFATDNLTDVGGTDNNQVKSKNISLLLAPREGAILKLAEKKGEVHLALRAASDHSDTEDVQFNDDDLAEVFSIDGSEYLDDKQDNSEGDVKKDDSQKLAQKDKDSSAKRFLDEEQEPQEMTSTEVEPELEEAKKMWQIEVYAGEEKIVQEVELLEEELDDQKAALKDLWEVFTNKQEPEKKQELEKVN